MADESASHSVALPDSLEWCDGASQLSDDMKVMIFNYEPCIVFILMIAGLRG